MRSDYWLTLDKCNIFWNYTFLCTSMNVRSNYQHSSSTLKLGYKTHRFCASVNIKTAILQHIKLTIIYLYYLSYIPWPFDHNDVSFLIINCLWSYILICVAPYFKTLFTLCVYVKEREPESHRYTWTNDLRKKVIKILFSCAGFNGAFRTMSSILTAFGVLAATVAVVKFIQWLIWYRSYFAFFNALPGETDFSFIWGNLQHVCLELYAVYKCM